ncbi:hypothetical protein OESDEN_04216 [Oesophagostomum dentatum]|uniref:Uncharacterized protein n=1 Tax=Oesophagostomum dentatum TaxID=61180 RepID=A0A0B1TEX9_OESDE|nr:hypothetical protein OESDEN_04216 [Oesophagostomum dentatum]
MNWFLLSLTLFAIVGAAEGLTCQLMDVPILELVSEEACRASCRVQDCDTGYCKYRGGRKICICSRCAGGGKKKRR